MGGRGEGETSAWATASSTFATNTNTRTHTHMYARCMHLESILCFFCSRCCAAAAAAPCSRCSCWRSSNAYEYLVCSARKMRLYRTTLLYKLHICMPYIYTHTCIRMYTHTHTGTHTHSLGSLVQRCVVCSSLCANNFTFSRFDLLLCDCVCLLSYALRAELRCTRFMLDLY